MVLHFTTENALFWRICRQNLDETRYKTLLIEEMKIDMDLIPSPTFSYVLRGLETKSTGPESSYSTR